MKTFDLKGAMLSLNTPNIVSLLNNIEFYKGKVASAKIKKPEVGFGVVGINTLSISLSKCFLISPFKSALTKPKIHNPLRGYSNITTFLNACVLFEKTVSNICFNKEYTEDNSGTLAINHSPNLMKNRPINPAANIPANNKNINNTTKPKPGIDIGK